MNFAWAVGFIYRSLLLWIRLFLNVYVYVDVYAKILICQYAWAVKMNKAHTCCADQTKSLLMLSICCVDQTNNVAPLSSTASQTWQVCCHHHLARKGNEFGAEENGAQHWDSLGPTCRPEPNIGSDLQQKVDVVELYERARFVDQKKNSFRRCC